MTEIVAIIVALASLVIAFWLGVKNQRLARENNALQERLVHLDEAREGERQRDQQKANLSARIVKPGRDYRLLIENSGVCEARDVSLLVDQVPFCEHPVSVRGETEVKVIGSKSKVTYMLAITLDRPPPFDVELSWEDDSGERGRYRTTLTF